MTTPTTEVGIFAAGAYIPPRRLQRKSIAAANAWFNAGLKGLAKGERAMAGWDEDAITMAVQAARAALGPVGAPARAHLRGLTLASTTHPIAAALHLPPALQSLDLAGSLRAGTQALGTAAAAVRGGQGATLVAAADKRQTKAASTQEMTYGDGAAAVLIAAAGDPAVAGAPMLARLLGTVTDTVDFIAQFRASGRSHDYAWEERWVRDEGYAKIVPAALARLWSVTGANPAEVAHFCLPSTLGRIGATVAKRAGIADTAVRDTLAAQCGDTGAAHPLVMLIHALEQAKVGEKIVVIGFGAGCDALLFEVTAPFAGAGVTATLAYRREEANYQKFLAFNGTVAMEHGMRSEVDKGTPLTSLYRNRDMVLGLIGGRCRACNTLQFPRARYCVNPACKALDSQDDHAFADEPSKIKSFTADALTYCMEPPACYGLIQFDCGGRMMADFTDIAADQLEVGLPMRMVFRVKDFDAQRGFIRYFWKAMPV
jgi:hydroxymethylglutaryl-CoA synthase